jgi:hypothetical protein
MSTQCLIGPPLFPAVPSPTLRAGSQVPEYSRPMPHYGAFFLNIAGKCRKLLEKVFTIVYKILVNMRE